MSVDRGSFETERWHSPEYVESWMDDQSREAERRALRERLVSLLPFEASQPLIVLDVGAGAGALTQQLITAYPNARVTCQDFSSVMLGHARERLRQFSGRVTFVQSDLKLPTWLKPVEGTFDAVVSTLVFHTVPTRAKAIYGEIFQVVKPGGCFLMGDSVAPAGPAVGAVYRKTLLSAHQAKVKRETGIEESLAEIEEELRERRRLRRHSQGRPAETFSRSGTLAVHLEWLRLAGFDEIDCLWKEGRRAIIAGFRYGQTQ